MFKALLILLVASALAAAVCGGLLRAGVSWPGLPESVLIGQAAVGHAALMICGFLGAVIGIERAVATRLRWAWTVPLASGLAAVLLLAGSPRLAAWLWVAAALVFIAVNIAVVVRQPAAHTGLLLVSAIAWLAGNLTQAAGQGGIAVVPWWFGFLVLTIAAERLEMTRLMRRHPMAQASLGAIVFALLAGAALSALPGPAGGIVFGASLLALAAWLGRFDIARRTVRTHGLSRYMAVCLLSGYAWLAIAGGAWAAMSLGWPTRDIALHALGLGFIVSMVMGHAPVILPAVARVKLHFGPWFYVPLALLHGSLVLRLAGGFVRADLLAAGALLNAASLLVFAATAAGSAIAWRRLHAPSLKARST